MFIKPTHLINLDHVIYASIESKYIKFFCTGYTANFKFSTEEECNHYVKQVLLTHPHLAQPSLDSYIDFKPPTISIREKL